MNIIEKLEFRDGLYEGLKKGIETYAKTATEEAIRDQVSLILREASADIVGAFVGTVAGSLLKSVLRVHDNIAANLDKLIREPYVTGVRVAQEAMASQWYGEDERLFREQRLRFGIEKLEEALTLAKDNKKYEEERFLICLLQGLCAVEIRGGRPLARHKFSFVIPKLVYEAERLEPVEQRAAERAERRKQIILQVRGASEYAKYQKENEPRKQIISEVLANSGIERKRPASSSELFALVEVLRAV